ncbi:glutamine synthetase family protein [Amycolatopsis regifaucium]|uniref:Glutamine synthetase n=1 Tax=Amycolatopsis regifaucium TaxID=546365 RepID=A0A154MV89_9PSEU|nr:glutamine synthetase family protein [Amycolatopsis regifaucium]KZB88264.1 glutamine synthetase [Amycolatopsis regifaucium]OKA11378.1 glutamine synthetase [Amycolatopsis regifaucium]SFH43255.1 L-glutamine synthetase [Amycolatopsis regifaucium]
MGKDVQDTVAELVDQGVVGVIVAWADNNGITRSRTVPVRGLASAARTGIGITPLFAVFDSHDAITFGHKGLATPSGDIRLMPEMDRLVRLSGQPGFAWAPGHQVAADGSAWAYDPRRVLERQVERAASAGLTVRAGYEMEFQLTTVDADGFRPVHDGPSYGPVRTLAVDGFAEQLLRDLDRNGVGVHQFHGEYGPGQFELSIVAHDPLTAADHQLLARQTIHAAARSHGLRASFSPLVETGTVGNGWHLHTSVSRDGVNLLEGGTGPHGLTANGAAYLAGLLRDLPAVVAVSAPSVVSLLRRRPGFWSGAYGFWGAENREASLRLVPGSEFLGAGHANVELKPSDASANPYLALAVVIAAGVSGIEDNLTPPDPVQQDPGTWTDAERADAGIRLLPSTVDEQLAALADDTRISAVLGAELADAFRAVRESDAAWAAPRSPEEVVAGHRWLY